MSLSENVATVVKVKNSKTVVINKGEVDDVEKGDIFALFSITDEKLIDPDTGDELGEYEEFKGDGIVIFVNRNTATIKSNNTKMRTRTSKPPSIFMSNETVIEESDILPFENPKKGDKARML